MKFKFRIERLGRQIKSSDESINNQLDELRSVEASLDESNLAKMKGLRETEEKFNRFLGTFPEYKTNEISLLESKEKSIKSELEKLKIIRYDRSYFLCKTYFQTKT